ncbi:YfiT family bacillithiol transferase [Parasediminibacterium sp. JCM 36343]|uniref:YfiT family bacillithiol transferase n=1 Tax=Parasediminibacterium sp. JCM 36343 TaxID=3374279 RepID=UPI00397DB1B0
MSDARYPIGKYVPEPYSEEQKKAWLEIIRQLPEAIEYAILNLDEAQLKTPYREGGWSVIQLVHHVADSHINAYIRFKLGLTELNPTIKPYEEKEWALLADNDIVPINVSITLLHALHQRWYATIKDLTDEQWERTVVHPEHGRQMSLWFLLGMYAWHSKHHVAHITSLRERNNW